MATYERVSVLDDEDIDSLTVEEGRSSSFVGGTQTKSIAMVPISRIPLTGRDISYSFLFLCHFGLILFLSTYDELDIEDSFIQKSSEALWTSMVLTATVLGFFFGGLVVFLLINQETREPFLTMSIPFSMLVQICLGNVLLNTSSEFSGIGLLFLLSAAAGIFACKLLTKDVGFNSALIQFIADVISSQFGISLVIVCTVISFMQTCILLWWGVFLVDFVGDVPQQYLKYIIMLMLFSLYWIMQFFHGVMSYIVGGSIVAYFLHNKDNQVQWEPSKRVVLHVKGALTCSLGSICKGALYCPISNQIVQWYHSLEQQSSNPPSHDLTGSYIGYCISCCGLYELYRRTFIRISLYFLRLIVPIARDYSRISYSLSATYGLTLSTSVTTFCSYYPHVIDNLMKDTSRRTLKAIPIVVASLVALLFGVFVASKEPAQTRLLFILLIYIFSYCGISISVVVFQSAIDALYVVFALAPESLATANQLIFLRLLRASEDLP